MLGGSTQVFFATAQAYGVIAESTIELPRPDSPAPLVGSVDIHQLRIPDIPDGRHFLGLINPHKCFDAPKAKITPMKTSSTLVRIFFTVRPRSGPQF